MKKIATVLSTLLILTITFTGFAQEKRRVFQGFDGGMMIHAGYLQGHIPSIQYQAKGATFGLGGVARASRQALDDWWRRICVNLTADEERQLHQIWLGRIPGRVLLAIQVCDALHRSHGWRRRVHHPADV